MSDIDSPQPEMPPTARPDVDPQSVEGLFLTVLAMESPAERAAFLDQVCGDDAPRRRRIDALLRAYDDAGSFLEHPATPVDSPENYDFLEPADKTGCIGRLGYYEVIDVIGRGGMGIVFRALDPRLNRIVAIKVLAPELAANPLARRRFLREAQAAAAVSHPHVVTIHAVDEAKLPYLVMECIVGQSLQQKLDHAGPLRLTEILRIGSQIAEGLAAAHRQGLIHRDIKPANILLENGVERVKITDFGLARAADDAAITRTGEVSGTPQYMSPEQAHGDKVDPRSDLFSLGCVLYAMCTGRSPFRADSVAAAIRRVCDDTPRPIAEINAEIPAWLIDLVDILLAKRPEDRFQTADEVAVALEKCLVRVQRPGDASQPTVERPLSTSQPVKDSRTMPETMSNAVATFSRTEIAITQFLGDSLFAGSSALVVALAIMSQFAPLPDRGIFLVEVSGIIGAAFLLTNVRAWFVPAEALERLIALAVQFSLFYCAWLGFLLGVALAGEWPTEDANLFLGVAGTIGLSMLTGVSLLQIRADHSGLDAQRVGRRQVLLGVGLIVFVAVWLVAIAGGALRPPSFDGPLSKIAGTVGIAVVWAGGLLFATGMFLQNRILGGSNWLYVLRIIGLGALVVVGLVTIISGLASVSDAMPGPIELVIVIAIGTLLLGLVVGAIVVAVHVLRGTGGGSSRTKGALKASGDRAGGPIRQRPNWLWTALIVFSVVCVAPCLLGVAYMSLSFSTIETQVAPQSSTSAWTRDVPVAPSGQPVGSMGAMPSESADGGMMGGMMGGGGGMGSSVNIFGGARDESKWGAILLDFGKLPANGMSPQLGMPRSNQMLSDRSVRILPVDADPGTSEYKDVHVRKEGELVYRAHPLTEPGIYRIAPGEYEIQLFDWSFGWALGRDVAETASYTPAAPRRPAAVRSLGTIRVQTGEIVTVSATRDDVSALLRGILATMPDMRETQLAQFLWNGEMFVLSPQQAKIVRYLLQRSAAGEAETTEAELRTGAGRQLAFTRKSDSGEPETQIVTDETPMREIFNDGRHPAWGKLIVPGSQAGTFKLAPLNLPQGTAPAVAVPEKVSEDLPADASRPEPSLNETR